MGVNLQTLKSRRSTTLQGMSNARMRITDLKDKLNRLKTASNALNGQISELNTIKSTIANLQNDGNMWKGKEKSEFDTHYEQYKTNTQNYITKTETAKSDIDEEISRVQIDLTNARAGLGNLTSTLESLNRQISQAEKE
ncbi:YwqH-like family protein [Pseudogracilibacillus sp. SO30301A]|uniref:YwqH-like family protein n=1 Tax=Pseudogracilibacillus sp. SO30301A TaxID=3098291 RepID=UPI00300E5696